MESPEYSMSDGDEGDADCQLTMALCFDDVRPKGADSLTEGRLLA